MGRTNDLLCLITLPDSYVLAIETQKTSCGFPIFDEVCRKLKILQKDFFGLQLKDDKFGSRWLNLRNQFSLEVNCSCPVKLVFSIKYFVQPHQLLQDSTREVFYKIARNNFISEQFNVVGEEFTNEVAAILRHCSDLNNEHNVTLSSHILPPSYVSEVCLKEVNATSSSLNLSNIAEARRFFLTKLSHCMSTVGHRHHAILKGSKVELCVLSSGLVFLSDKLEILSNYTWTSIRQATHNGCDVTIHFISADQLLFTMKNKVLANAFYRDLTEVYTFFNCDTVDDIITHQTCRDLKGTIVSLFNENSNLGRAYVFDIEHTLKEMSDLIRRHIYNQDKRINNPLPWSTELSAGKTQKDINNELSYNKEWEYLNELRELFTCTLCVENLMDTVFIPCGHVFCCKECSLKISQCPLCKGPINIIQHIYLPNFSHVSLSPA